MSAEKPLWFKLSNGCEINLLRIQSIEPIDGSPNNFVTMSDGQSGSVLTSEDATQLKRLFALKLTHEKTQW